MNSYLNMTSGGIAKHNDFSTHDDSQTTNHIYLHPGPNQGEFDHWMRRIGSLLQVGADYTALRPVLALIIEVFEDRKSVVEGKRVVVRVDIGVRRSIKKKKQSRRR